MRPSGEVGLWPVVIQATGGSGVESRPSPIPWARAVPSPLVNTDLRVGGLRSALWVGRMEQGGLGLQARTHPTELSPRGQRHDGDRVLWPPLVGDPRQLRIMSHPPGAGTHPPAPFTADGAVARAGLGCLWPWAAVSVLWRWSSLGRGPEAPGLGCTHHSRAPQSSCPAAVLLGHPHQPAGHDDPLGSSHSYGGCRGSPLSWSPGREQVKRTEGSRPGSLLAPKSLQL